MNGRYIVGLDVGATKVCAAVTRVWRDGLEVIGTGTGQPTGLRRGVVVDIHVTAEAMKKAVSGAETASGVEVKAAYIGVSGSHVTCVSSRGATAISGREVTRKDVERAVSAASLYVPLERTVLHVLPVDFVVDEQEGVVEPLGMSGARLEANVKVITASQAAVDNLRKCCEKAGVDVIELVFEPLALCRALATPEELESGVAVVDVGGDITTVAVFRGGAMRLASVIPVGGYHFTNDIAIGLRLSRKEAEHVKKRYARALRSGEDSEEIEMTTMHGIRRIQTRHLLEVVRPRCQEIFELVRGDIEDFLIKGALFSVVLAGGGALLRGIEVVAGDVLGLRIRTGEPGGKRQMDLRYSVSAGLARYGLETEKDAPGTFITGAFDRARQWALNVMEIKGSGLGVKKLLGDERSGFRT